MASAASACWQPGLERSPDLWAAEHLLCTLGQREALLYNAVAEIGIGFVTILGLLIPPRNFLVPFFVFNFLRVRYWSPDAATYHRQVGAPVCAVESYWAVLIVPDG